MPMREARFEQRRARRARAVLRVQPNLSHAATRSSGRFISPTRSCGASLGLMVSGARQGERGGQASACSPCVGVSYRGNSLRNKNYQTRNTLAPRLSAHASARSAWTIPACDAAHRAPAPEVVRELCDERGRQLWSWRALRCKRSSMG